MTTNDSHPQAPTVADTASYAGSPRHLQFLAVSFVWLWVVYAVSRGPAMEVSAVGLGMLLLGVPMCMAGICTNALRRHRWLPALFRKQGRLYKLLSKGLMSILFWTIAGLFISFFMLLQFHVHEPLEWAVVAATIPLFTLLFAFLSRRLRKAGVHSDMAVTEGLAWTRVICPAVVLGLYVVAMVAWGDLPKYESIEGAIAAHTPDAADRSRSALVRETLLWVGYFDGLKAYAIGHLGPTDALGAWLLVGLLLGNYVLLYFACFALSCFLIPRAGFERVRLPPGSRKDVFIIAAYALFLVLFIFLALSHIEARMSQSPEPARFRTNVQAAITPAIRVVVEQIGAEYYYQGAREQIVETGNEAALPVAVAAELLRREVDATFERLETEAVDEYLDWYYSLTAEWGQIVKLLMGGLEGLEGHLADKMRETFEQEKWYAGAHSAFERLKSADEEARIAYARDVREILDRNRVSAQRLKHAAIEVVSVAVMEDVLDPSFHEDAIRPAVRFFGAAAAGGGVASITAKKIRERVVAKRVLTRAATGPVKAILSKAAGRALIAAVGLSVVPGLGTAAGAVGALGTTIVIDALVLEAEEALNRDDFKRELVTAVREARREFEDQMLGTTNAPK